MDSQAVLKKLQSMKVLFVEDEDNIQTLISGLFSDLGVDCKIAGNGQEAFDTIMESKDTNPFGLIITDLNMPIMSGIGLCELLQENNIDIPVIVISAYTEGQYIDRAKELGVKYYLNKPFEFSQLMEFVSEL